jgi:hypothetical protein
VPTDISNKFNKYGFRQGTVQVCINTDDCALMPTTIANEHRVIKNAAISHHNIGTTIADDWINKIMKKGVDTFDSNHLDWKV